MGKSPKKTSDKNKPNNTQDCSNSTNSVASSSKDKKNK